MNKFPLFSNEVDISKINISKIESTNNKQFCNISYNEDESLYLQSPIFKFIDFIKRLDQLVKQHRHHLK